MRDAVLTRFGDVRARRHPPGQMQLAQVEGFLEVAHRANLSRAAEACFRAALDALDLSRAAITHLVNNLEERNFRSHPS